MPEPVVTLAKQPYASQYYLGCPVWSTAEWKGTVYAAKAPQKNWLKQYSRTFGTVEGNTTFYAIPALETFHRWSEQVEPGFRFALKLPRVITHDKSLKNAQVETDQFLQGLQILSESGCLGPTFLQFHERFGPSRFQDLEGYLRNLPKEFPFAVEVRDHAWFQEPFAERLNGLLEELGMDRVIFDSRPLYSAPPTDEIEARAQGRKPRSPVRQHVTGSHPFLRFIGRNQVESVVPWIQQWTPIVATWIEQGKVPFIFMHTPHDKFAPDLAVIFHRQLAQHVSGMSEELAFPNRARQQLDLF